MPGVEKCGCGWELPLSVLAYSLKDVSHQALGGSCVKLVCPRCESGHQFFNADDEQSVVEYFRKFPETAH